MSLLKSTIKGLIWSFASQGGRQIVQFIIIIILARLLSPIDFGLIAMAAVFIDFAAIFADMGISSALIQKQELKETHYHSAFWVNVGLAILLAGMFAIIAPLIANFYKRPELVKILLILSSTFVISSLGLIQKTILTRNMDFKSLAIRDIVSITAGGAVGIVLAYRGFGVWSLVCQLIAFTAVDIMLLWILSPWRPKMVFNKSDIADIINFSANLTGFNVINYFGRNIDQLIIGRFLGATVLGIYSLAYKIMLYPIQNISAVVSKVVFPAFSKIQNEIETLATAYLRMLKSISLITFPLMGCLFIVAEEFVGAIFGSQWNGAILLVKIFCFCGMIQSVSTTASNIFLSRGRSDLHFKYGVISNIVVVIAILAGLNWGAEGIAVFYTTEQIIWGNFIVIFAGKLVNLRPADLLGNFKNSIIVCVVLTAVAFVVKLTPLSDINTLLVVAFVNITAFPLLLVALKEAGIKDGKLILNR